MSRHRGYGYLKALQCASLSYKIAVHSSSPLLPRLGEIVFSSGCGYVNVSATWLSMPLAVVAVAVCWGYCSATAPVTSLNRYCSVWTSTVPPPHRKRVLARYSSVSSSARMAAGGMSHLKRLGYEPTAIQADSTGRVYAMDFIIPKSMVRKPPASRQGLP